MKIKESQLRKLIRENLQSLLNEQVGTSDDLWLFMENNEDCWSLIYWLQKALEKKVRRGLTPDKEFLMNCSTMAKIVQLGVRLYNKKICELRLLPEEKIALKSKIADYILRNIQDDMQNIINERIESIVSKTIKSVLKENVPFSLQRTFPDGKIRKDKQYICTADERIKIMNILDSYSEKACDRAEEPGIVEVEIDEPIELGGIDGNLCGTASYDIDMCTYRRGYDSSDYETETEIDGCELDDYELYFQTDDDNDEIEILLKPRVNNPKDNIEDTDVKRRYEAERREEMNRKYEMERQRMAQEEENFKQEVLANREKYLQIAKQYEEEGRRDYWRYSDAAKIYSILGMNDKARECSQACTSGYHHEEGNYI